MNKDKVLDAIIILVSQLQADYRQEIKNLDYRHNGVVVFISHEKRKKYNKIVIEYDKPRR